METLKRILTVMVVTLVLIIVAGGVYTFGMGGMNHGTGSHANMTTAQNNSSSDTKKNQSTENTGSASNENSMPGMNSGDSKESGKSQQPNSQQQQNNQTPFSAGVPVIIQPPPEPKTDPRLYVEQLKEKVKAINEANAQIASNTGGPAMVVQPNGSAVSSDQSNMKELHQGFYKLGQNITSMEQTLDNQRTDELRHPDESLWHQYFRAS